VLALDPKGVYHFNPLDARQVGKLCKKHRATILLSTPTFLRTYVRRCEPDDFATLDTIVTGAEKLPKDVADTFEAKFGCRPVEGYGTTELSPLVSVNVPPSRSTASRQVDRREGSVGRAVPGVAAKVIGLEQGEPLPAGKPGMLLIKGANVMKGYLDQPEKTTEVIRDGWYVTGDVALIDEDGFIHITGRESRFSKIGGEMVPHLKVEESLQQILGADRDDGPQVAVTAVPDARKGERLIVVHTPLDRTPSDLCDALKKQGLPNLFIPSEDSFCEVASLPVLGTGKLDLRKVKQIAEQGFVKRSQN
jgi:acyl-[acyl-carrier-protein]-phospholipid O-acyltransferase/long-chain-fatty-acid--[acyl-carrier-protein] ligase